MKVGYLGAGKLAFPIALAVEEKGHEVLVRDYAPYVDDALRDKKWPFQEVRVDELLQNTKIRNVELSELVAHSEIIFVAVQTPHLKEYEGVNRLPTTRSDFDYSFLEIAICQLVEELRIQKDKNPVVVVISTILPGTMRERIVPMLVSRVEYAYNPAFPAMGTVINDFLYPEFVLIGTDGNIPEQLYGFYNSVIPARVAQLVEMSIESAEMAKVSYNCLLSNRIATINALGEMCHKIPNCDVNDVTGVLKLATKRLAPTAYMNSGVSDSGPCLTGDTKISLLNGKEVAIKDLVDLSEFYVYSYDIKKQEVVPGRGTYCRLTKKDVDVVEVLLDNGEKIKCTLGHLFLLKNGRYIVAHKLKSGDSLMPLYRRINKEGYEESLHPVKGEWQKTHRIVFYWKYGKMIRRHVAHHKDFDKRNNSPANIAAMQWKEHWLYHSRLAKRMIAKLIKEGKLNTPEHRAMTTKRNLTNNPAWRDDVKKKISAASHRITQQKLTDGTHHTLTNNPAYKLMEEGRHNFQVDHPMKNSEKKNRMIQKLNDYYAKKAGFESHEKSIRVVQKLFREGLSPKEISSKLGVGGRFVNYRLALGSNHKVVLVTSCGKEDVYNFEVDTHHNYAVSAEVFLHNCHPRDNIAMSWLSKKLKLSYDPFDAAAKARESHSDWLANLIEEQVKKTKLPLYLFGKSYKSESNIVTGSAAILLANILLERGIKFEHYDPFIDGEKTWVIGPMLVFISTKHDCFTKFRFSQGSVVIDPHRYILEQEGVTLIPIGVGK